MSADYHVSGVGSRSGEPLHVVHFHRRPDVRHFSIERAFAQVRNALPSSMRCEVVQMRFPSTGLIGRALNVLQAAMHQGDVSHVTGDVHYLTYLLARKRTVLTIHDCVGLDRLTGLRREVLRLLWYTLPILRSNVITVVSEFTKRELLRHVRCDPDQIEVIPNCYSPEFHQVPRAFNAIRPVLLHIGTFANKNLIRLAEALSGVTCHLRIIGMLSSDQQAALNRAKIDYSSVDIVSDAELVQEYATSDLLAFPSTYEGFGMPIVEAQVVGRAVVTSNVASMPEVGGKGACYVDPFDVRSIRSGIMRVIEDQAYRESLVAAGSTNAERFRIESIAARYAQLYFRLGAHARSAAALPAEARSTN